MSALVEIGKKFEDRTSFIEKLIDSLTQYNHDGIEGTFVGLMKELEDSTFIIDRLTESLGEPEKRESVVNVLKDVGRESEYKIFILDKMIEALKDPKKDYGASKVIEGIMEYEDVITLNNPIYQNFRFKSLTMVLIWKFLNLFLNP